MFLKGNRLVLNFWSCNGRCFLAVCLLAAVNLSRGQEDTSCWKEVEKSRPTQANHLHSLRGSGLPRHVSVLQLAIIHRLDVCVYYLHSDAVVSFHAGADTKNREDLSSDDQRRASAIIICEMHRTKCSMVRWHHLRIKHHLMLCVSIVPNIQLCEWRVGLHHIKS
jgi:hypothetical protein